MCKKGCKQGCTCKNNSKNNNCKPKRSVCCSQEKRYYCGKDNDCIGICKEDDIDHVIGIVADQTCNLKNITSNLFKNQLIFEVNPECENGFIVKDKTGEEQYNYCGEYVFEENLTCPNGGFNVISPNGDTVLSQCYPEEPAHNSFEGNISCPNGGFTVKNGDGDIIFQDCYPEEKLAQYGNTLFVDKVYGNNTTGTRERFDLPYLTINSALADASSGDNIIVRAGIYNETIILEDGVNIYFEENTTLNGRITDNGSSVTSKISGEGAFNNYINLIEITGSSSDISIKCDTINGFSAPILIRPLSEGNCKVFIECRKITGVGVNYCSTIYGDPVVTINVLESIETLPTTNPDSGLHMFHFEGGYSGETYIKTPKVYIGDSINGDSGILLWEGPGNIKDGIINLQIDKVDIDYDYDIPNVKGIINKIGASKAVVKIGKLKSKKRPIFLISQDTENLPYLSNGSLLIEGNYYSESDIGIQYGSTQKVVAKNSVFTRGSGGTNRAEVVLIGGSWGGSWNIVVAATDYKIELLNSKIIKNGGNGEIPNSSMIYKTVADVPVILNCFINMKGTGTVNTISKDNITNDGFFVSNTVGNIDNAAANITHLKAVGETYYYSPDFTTFEDLD